MTQFVPNFIFIIWGSFSYREPPQFVSFQTPQKLDLPVFQTLLLDSCVIWGKSLKLLVPQFAHLQSGNENSTYLLELMRGLMT